MINNTTNPYVTLAYLLLCHTVVPQVSNTTVYNPYNQKQLIVAFKPYDETQCIQRDAINKMMLLVASESLNFVRLYDSNTMIFRTDWNNEFCIENILQQLPFIDYVEEDIMMNFGNFYWPTNTMIPQTL